MDFTDYMIRIFIGSAVAIAVGLAAIIVGIALRVWGVPI